MPTVGFMLYSVVKSSPRKKERRKKKTVLQSDAVALLEVQLIIKHVELVLEKLRKVHFPGNLIPSTMVLFSCSVFLFSHLQLCRSVTPYKAFQNKKTLPEPPKRTIQTLSKSPVPGLLYVLYVPYGDTVRSRTYGKTSCFCYLWFFRPTQGIWHSFIVSNVGLESQLMEHCRSGNNHSSG